MLVNDAISLDSIDALSHAIRPWLRQTPTLTVEALGVTAPVRSIVAKFELWQQTGSFKARAALANIMALTDAQKTAGVTAVSAGNHAIATAYAAQTHGIHAKVVMPESAPLMRVQRCLDYGAEVVMAPDVHGAFSIAEGISREEARAFIHPFEGMTTAIATAGVGLELMRAASELDAVVVPVGGGGLAAGVATAVRLSNPDCEVFGVEPIGAASMQQSIAAGQPLTLEKVHTIADSLGAPMALPISFRLCRQNLTEVVTVSDADIILAMLAIRKDLSMLVEPACAAGLAAVNGPLASRLQDKRVGLIFCGSNIDLASWTALVRQ